MAASIELERRLRWADADAAGRLHFPRIFELIEEAESELVRSINWPMNRSLGYDFPRVHVECRFLKVLSLDDPFRSLGIAREAIASLLLLRRTCEEGGAAPEVLAAQILTIASLVAVDRGGFPLRRRGPPGSRPSPRCGSR